MEVEQTAWSMPVSLPLTFPSPQYHNMLTGALTYCALLQMVERLDEGSIPNNVCPTSYSALHKLVAKALFRAHVEGKPKVNWP